MPGEINWDRAQHLYETTKRPIDDIARELSTSPTSIIARASRYGWSRNKTNQVVTLTAELAAASRLTREEERRIRFQEVEKVNLLMKAELLQSHRTEIKAAKKICNDAFQALNSHPTMDLYNKSAIIKRLSDSLKTFILLERQAYGISTAIEDPEAPPSQSVEDKTITTLVEKFASVMSRFAPPPADTTIIDVPSSDVQAP